MRKNINKIFIALMMYLLVCLPIYAETLHIQTIEVAPFGMKDKDDQASGMMFEISNKIAQEAGFKFSNKVVPYARTILELQQGNADFVLRYSNEKLPQVAIPVASVISMQTIVLSNSMTTFDSIKSLHGKKIGVVRGGKFDDKFDKDKNIIKTPVSDYQQMLKMLITGRLDGAIGSNVGLYYNAKELGISPDYFSKPLQLNHKHFILHYSKKTATNKTTSKLKKSIKKLKEKHIFKSIVDKYMGDFIWDIPIEVKE